MSLILYSEDDQIIRNPPSLPLAAMTTNADKLFLGRQPIINRQHEVIGYELLFRPAAATLEDGACQSLATADVVCNAFAELGLAQALGHQRGFIHVDRAFLANDLLLVLPATTVVLLVDVADMGAPERARLRDLRSAGYALALCGLDRLDAQARECLELASYVCLSVDIDAEISLLPQLRALQLAQPLVAVATGVNDPKLQARAELLGFDAFQGYAFARPELVAGRKLDASKQALLRLLGLLQQDGEVSVMEQVMKGQPALVANLLRLSNSAAIGSPVRITSIRQAISMIGLLQLQRWVQLLLFANPNRAGGLRTNPLMQLAALRGHFMELLVQRCYPARREMLDPAFIVGIMSVMPAALELPMAEILAQLPVSEEVQVALSARSNALGQLIDLIEAYDNDDVGGAAKKLAQLGGRLGEQTLNLCLTEAIGWVLQLEEAEAA